MNGCDTPEHCITCGDVALPLTVESVGAEGARCRDDAGRAELVAVDLVGEVRVGDRVLVHAGVALARLPDLTGDESGEPAP